MNNETKAVDVLAAYDRAMSVCNDDITDTSEVADVFDELRQARAAMAEFMEAVRTLIARHDEDAKLFNFERCGCSVCIELRPSLVRCGGFK